MKKFYLTTPIYYVNSKPHLGHVYTTLIADTVASYKRQRKFDVFFLTGTDEHGQNIERAAAKENRPLQQHVDAIVDEFKQAFARFNFKYDHWIRTTDDYHIESVQELFRRAQANGYIYKGHYEGWYCVNCGEFKEETEPGKAPFCEDHGKPAERLAEESYFFKLSEFQDRLLALYQENPTFIQPESRRNEVLSFVRGGLKDLSVSRVSVKWGIPVPDDPKHTMYVWFDALSNYITALGWGNKTREGFDKYWPADLQLVGKDILRFHTVYWPSFLMAAGIEPPKMVFAHGMWLSGGRKMGKTLGNVIDLNILHKYFTSDQIRYFCMREMAFGQDGDFTYEAFIDRVNSDLAKGLGNLSSRTLKMVEKYFGSELPARPAIFGDSSATEKWQQDALAVRESALNNRMRFETEFTAYNFSRGLEAIWEIIASVDKYISDSAPWNVAKDSAQRAQLETIIYTALEAIRHITVLLAPVMPEATESIWALLGLTGSPAEIDPTSLQWGELNSGSRIPEIKALFPTIDKEKTMSEIDKDRAENAAPASTETAPAAEAATPAPAAAATEATPSPTPATEAAPVEAKPLIAIDDFLKVDLRVGLVLEAERIPKADKLLKLSVDIGEEKPRQILAGIAQHYTPEQMKGRKIVIIANLQPRKLRGLESQGMLLAASVGEQGSPVLAGFLEDVPVGAKLK